MWRKCINLLQKRNPANNLHHVAKTFEKSVMCDEEKKQDIKAVASFNPVHFFRMEMFVLGGSTWSVPYYYFQNVIW